jgi:hypothetical protein
MEETEVIFVNSIPEKNYYDIVLNSVKYAIISIPFTIDRMSLRNRNEQIFNIAKGKIAEGLFKFFCQHNEIDANFAACETPFYQIDRRDFLLLGAEWDQKNNFIYHLGDKLMDKKYVDLPALIPNRPARRDQWQKRLNCYFKNTASVKFLFTFMKAADSKKKRGNFFSINLSHRQIGFLDELYKKYQGLPQEKKPYQEVDFWKEMKSLKGDQKSLLLHNRPVLVITGYADERHWELFFDTENMNFLHGVLKTKIRNKTCSVRELPSFISFISAVTLWDKIWIYQTRWSPHLRWRPFY